MRNFVLRYLLPRLGQYLVVIFLGVTITYIIPRLSPSDPVERQVAEIMVSGAHFGPEAIAHMRDALTDMYGLRGSPMEQYFAFWARMFQGDLGPSLSRFPTPVISLIARALPWTLGLLITAVMISWVIGNILGAYASYYEKSGIMKVIDVASQAVRPIPYYIVAVIFLIVFAYFFPIFPAGGAYPVGRRIELSIWAVQTILRHSTLPALSLVTVGMGAWFIGMKSLTSNIISEDYVVYAEVTGLPQRKILYGYIMPNALLPQVTGLALNLGMIFSGALIMEVVFVYPGMGMLTYQAVLANDYSLIMGIAIFSIVGVATAVLILDLIYPLFDPRVRHQ
ncbi:MAG: ABC transporter permease [Spirochaetaceae bacterium]|nr:MAG: ABC transporter permease [Spirochaetaceae bacterium]